MANTYIYKIPFAKNCFSYSPNLIDSIFITHILAKFYFLREGLIVLLCQMLHYKI